MGRQGTCQRVCDTDAHHLVSESRFGLAVPGDSCRDCVVKALLGAAVGFPDAIDRSWSGSTARARARARRRRSGRRHVVRGPSRRVQFTFRADRKLAGCGRRRAADRPPRTTAFQSGVVGAGAGCGARPVAAVVVRRLDSVPRSGPHHRAWPTRCCTADRSRTRPASTSRPCATTSGEACCACRGAAPPATGSTTSTPCSWSASSSRPRR